ASALSGPRGPTACSQLTLEGMSRHPPLSRVCVCGGLLLRAGLCYPRNGGRAEVFRSRRCSASASCWSVALGGGRERGRVHRHATCLSFLGHPSQLLSGPLTDLTHSLCPESS